MKKTFAILLALTMVLTLCLTGCGGGGGERVVNVCGWGENIDPALLDQFEKETGIRVNYQTSESNESMYALIKQGGADYDVIVPSDYMIGQMIE
ncbi:MAG: extracellular solute-binding protein, partial [Oscillospiraceae bacterium]|nr:extracellular solute-binding protein [Oscillospiraceae bacterium]